MAKYTLISCLLISGLISSSFKLPYQPAELDRAVQWADSVYQTMTPDERIGQLIMIRAHSDKGAQHIEKVKGLIKEYKVGGLCFFQGTPEKQVQLINEYQSLAQPVPMMIAMDAEWGLGMRMKESTISFPYQLMLGAIQDNRLLYDMGQEIARQLREVGVQINFAPVADVNNNPLNPVINYRSFGEDRYNVAVKSYMYMKGMQDHQVMACAKHFPGHGDTDTDSHYDLPVITHDYDRLDSVELFPFSILAERNIGSMMVAHLHVPALDERDNRPTTLSYNTVTRLLKEGMNYEGLIFTDGLGMEGVRKYFADGEVEAEALLAGNDVLLLPQDVAAAVSRIKTYLAEGKLSWEELEKSVKKILIAKHQLGLTKYRPIAVEGVRARVNSSHAKALKRTLVANALTLVRDEEKQIPIEPRNELKVASLSIGASGVTDFQERLLAYQKMPVYQSEKAISATQSRKLLEQLSNQDVVLVGMHDMSQYASKKFGIHPTAVDFIRQLSQRTKVVLTLFGNPYSLKYFDGLPTVLVAYEENEDTQDLAAQALFGAIGLKGRLPVTVSEKSKYGDGEVTRKLARFGYAPPESQGLDTHMVNDIRAIARNAVDARATPGCVVLVAKNGQIIFEEAFGHHTYKKETPAAVDDIYDLASLTKIASATLAIMKLYEEGKVALDTPIVRYLPELEGTNKAQLVLRDIMAHRAGLKDWIPFYQETVEKSRRRTRQKKEFFRSKAERNYSVGVASSLFLREDFIDTIYTRIYQSRVYTSQGYEYSDLGFYLISRIVEATGGMPLNEFVARHFYWPMGLETATYNPLEHFSADRIPPTERDNYFRLQTVQGYVHDMGAAMLGGVSGHAGLFASARDVAAIMQMLLNGGDYAGQQFLQPATVDTFTQRHPEDTRRGLGFDMRQLNPKRWLNLPATSSVHTFGHTGFTGTCAWADPEHELVYVFLSNRTYPSMNNYKLNKMKTRRRILSSVYDAMEEETIFLPEEVVIEEPSSFGNK
jgi:beta-glucosidase-like glycosyl hydrolase/CubicO group peptidase (beta-lactamase class C family)